MATSNQKQPKTNLASLVMVKQKMTGKNDNQSNVNGLSTQPAPVVGAHFEEKIHYRQVPSIAPTQETTTTTTTEPSTNTNEIPKASRQLRQIEVKLLDKKMEEIDRKQETTKNETLDTWKGFDSLNYGFNAAPTPVPPREVTPVKKQSAKTSSSPKRELTPVRQKSPSPKRELTPVRQQSAKKTRPTSLEKARSRTQTLSEQRTPTPPGIPQKKDVSSPSPPPRNEKPIEKPPSPPIPPPRLSKISSAPSVDPNRSPEPNKPNSVPSKSPVSLFPSIEQKPMSIPNNQHFRLFPDIKRYELSRSKNAMRSIQRSMDRYRFHVW